MEQSGQVNMGAAPMPQAPTAAPVAMPQQMDMQQPMAQPIPAPQAMPPAVENTPAAAPIAMPPADPVAQQAPAPQQSFSMQTINNTIPNATYNPQFVYMSGTNAIAVNNIANLIVRI